MDASAEEGSNSELHNTSWNVDHENSICKVSGQISLVPQRDVAVIVGTC